MQAPLHTACPTFFCPDSLKPFPGRGKITSGNSRRGTAEPTWKLIKNRGVYEVNFGRFAGAKRNTFGR